MEYEMESKCHNNLEQPPTFDSNNSISVCVLYVHMLAHKIDMEPYKHAVANKQASFQAEHDGRTP